jgi:hypothetical protein
MWTFGKKKFTADEVKLIATQAAGAATIPFMEDRPYDVFPSDEIIQHVNYVLSTYGIEEWETDWAE